MNELVQYRKLANLKNYYKIIDSRNFEEIQLIGDKIKHFKFHATQYPEILRIMDMLDTSSLYVVATEEEWEEKFNLLAK